MPAKLKTERHLETAHVLFIDVVGYSKLLVNEQREVVQELNQLVRKTPQFRKSEAAGKLTRIPVGEGMALVFFQTPEEPVQCAMEIARALKPIRRFGCGWASIAAQSIRSKMSMIDQMLPGLESTSHSV